jgi:hypothetical protein
MALLTKAQILAADDLLREVVPVPEWGGEVMVRGLDGAARDQYEAEFLLIGEIQAGERPTYELDLLNARARLVALSVVDENDQRLFSDEDVVDLGKKSAQALDRVYEVAQRLSGLSKQDVEELRKNSRRGRRGGSTSA